MTAHLPELAVNPTLTDQDVVDDYLAAITRAITDHPRSQQKALGPSEIGIACPRRIAYKLLNYPEPEQVNWRATVGTAVHAWLETVFDADNMRRATTLGGQERWLIETRLDVAKSPTLGTISGSCDLYDRLTGTVIDHKAVGPSMLKMYRSKGPSQQYRAQAHLYGLGWAYRRMPVTTVAIAFLPRNGELAEAHVWREPWQPQIALDALARVEGIALAVKVRGRDALALLGTADNYCGNCPFYRPGSADPALGCPGDPGSATHRTPTPALTFG